MKDEKYDVFQIQKQIKKATTDISRSFDSFINKLISLLFEYDYISQKKISEAQAFLKTNIYSLRGDRKRKKSIVKEWILDKWFSRTLNEIDFSIETDRAYVRKRFRKLFMDYYEKCGYSQDNYLYRPFKILLVELVMF